MRTLATWVVLVASLVLAAPAAAQDAASTQRFDEGVEHLRAERYEEAAAAFRESYRLEPRVATMCNLALTYDRWGSDYRAQAVRAYRACALEDGQGRFGPFALRRAGEIERDLALEESRAAAEPREVLVDPPEPEPRVGPEPRETPRPAESGPDEGLIIAGSTLVGVAALALVPAIVLALDAQGTVDALHAELGPSPMIVRGSDAHARLRAAETNATAATALYVGAGVAAAAGITLVLIGVVARGDGEHDDAAAFAIVPSGEGVSIAFARRF